MDTHEQVGCDIAVIPNPSSLLLALFRHFLEMFSNTPLQKTAEFIQRFNYTQVEHLTNRLLLVAMNLSVFFLFRGNRVNDTCQTFWTFILEEKKNLYSTCLSGT